MVKYLLVGLLIIAFSGSPARSQEVSWGASYAKQIPCDDATICIKVANRLSQSTSIVVGSIHTEFTDIQIFVSNGPGNQPDYVHIDTPTGWVADKTDANLEENTDTIFKLYAPGA